MMVPSELKFSRKLLFIVIIIIIVLIVLFFTIRIGIILSNDTFYKGISIEKMDLSGLKPTEAKILIDDFTKKMNADRQVIFKYGDFYWKTQESLLGIEYLTAKALEQGYMIGREGNYLSRFFKLKEINKISRNIDIQAQYDKEKVMAYLANIGKKINTEPKGALCYYKNGKITYEKEILGVKMDINGSLAAFENAIKIRNFKEIPVVLEDWKPSAMLDNIKSITNNLASSMTSFNEGDFNRSFNIRYACERINGFVIMPGETFSMNKMLGPRTIENGYKDAKVILGDDLVDGTGGGICQVTTTLYGAVLKSKLQVVERTHHSFPLAYIPAGQDATIAENYLDFKFINNKEYPISIYADGTRSNINIKIFGAKQNDYVVKLSSVIVEEYKPDPNEVIIDHTMPLGESIMVREPKKGMRVFVYRELYDLNGKLIEKEKISDDIYRPVRGQVRMRIG